MDDQENNYKYTHAPSSVKAVHDKHAYATDQGPKYSGPPIEVVEGRPEIWGRANGEEEAGKICHQKCH